MEEWKNFKPGKWQTEINVSDFIKNNYHAYDGTDEFLEKPTEKTKTVWKKCEKLLKE